MSTSPFLRNALNIVKKAAVGGQPSDLYEAQYWEMAGAHALLINGLLSIYEVSECACALPPIPCFIKNCHVASNGHFEGEACRFRKIRPSLVCYNGTSSPVCAIHSLDRDRKLICVLPSFSWEEIIYYPMFNPKFDTSFIVAEHAAFQAGAEIFEEYLVSTLPSGSKYGFGQTAPEHERQAYDGASLQSLIDVFAAPLATHVNTAHTPASL